MYGLRSKLVYLLAHANVFSKQACFLKPEDTSLLRNLSISRKLRIRNVL